MENDNDEVNTCLAIYFHTKTIKHSNLNENNNEGVVKNEDKGS